MNGCFFGGFICVFMLVLWLWVVVDYVGGFVLCVLLCEGGS